jgi:hypothetical protein
MNLTTLAFLYFIFGLFLMSDYTKSKTFENKILKVVFMLNAIGGVFLVLASLILFYVCIAKNYF